MLILGDLLINFSRKAQWIPSSLLLRRFPLQVYQCQATDRATDDRPVQQSRWTPCSVCSTGSQWWGNVWSFTCSLEAAARCLFNRHFSLWCSKSKYFIQSRRSTDGRLCSWRPAALGPPTWRWGRLILSPQSIGTTAVTLWTLLSSSQDQWLLSTWTWAWTWTWTWTWTWMDSGITCELLFTEARFTTWWVFSISLYFYKEEEY